MSLLERRIIIAAVIGIVLGATLLLWPTKEIKPQQSVKNLDTPAISDQVLNPSVAKGNQESQEGLIRSSTNKGTLAGNVQWEYQEQTPIRDKVTVRDLDGVSHTYSLNGQRAGATLTITAPDSNTATVESAAQKLLADNKLQFKWIGQGAKARLVVISPRLVVTTITQKNTTTVLEGILPRSVCKDPVGEALTRACEESALPAKNSF